VQDEVFTICGLLDSLLSFKTGLTGNQGLISQYCNTISSKEINPFYPLLRQQLQDNFAGLHVVSINISDRITREQVSRKKEIIQVNAGAYDEAMKCSKAR
jgi:hypothetical protein